MKFRNNPMKAVTHFSQWPQRYVALGAIAGMTLGGCNLAATNSADSAQSDLLDVVATSTIIADWAEQVGGNNINLTGLLQPGADPHVYEPTPADSRAFEEAELILYNGYNLEPGLIRMMNAAGVGADQLAVGEVVPPLQMEEDGQLEPDPHVWGNVENAIVMVGAIRDALVERSPQYQTTFEQNATVYIEELEQLHDWIGEQIATIPANQRYLVTTHDAFQYYAEAYGLEIGGTLIGISTEEQPSAQTVQRLIESVRAAGVPTIFAETTINPRLIGTVAEEAGVQLAPQELYSDSIGSPSSGGDTYIKMMESNTQAIVENLGGSFSPFSPN